eukprot:m.34281 g.34281  ORF g.34281 m.34281 type:complete len:57 (-) comp9515_c1_seq2:26-196(-)
MHVSELHMALLLFICLNPPLHTLLFCFCFAAELFVSFIFTDLFFFPLSFVCFSDDA